MGHHRATDGHQDRGPCAVAPARQEHRVLRGQARRRTARPTGARRPVKHVPDLPGVLTADELHTTGEHLASLQVDTGMIPWFPGGHCDPWNHVESAMALDIAGFHDEAERAYDWLVDAQRPDGSWHAYYHADGTIEDAKLDTNVCAYIATGVTHHLRLTWDRGFAENMWPTVERALEFVMLHRRPVCRCGRSSPTGNRGTTPCSPAPPASSTHCVAGPDSPNGWANITPTGSQRLTPWPRPCDTDPTRSSRRPAGRWTGTTRCSPGCSPARRRRLAWPTAGTPSRWRAWGSDA